VKELGIASFLVALDKEDSFSVKRADQCDWSFVRLYQIQEQEVPNGIT